MSADNGVYILETGKGKSKEYRVKHLQAVENVYWDENRNRETDDPDVWIGNARRMWNNCEVLSNKAEAVVEADRIASDPELWILEYGICTIRIPRDF